LCRVAEELSAFWGERQGRAGLEDLDSGGLLDVLSVAAEDLFV
jgi:hypothetical protein